MFNTTVNAKFLEKLTTENAALLIVDHQIGLYTGVKDIKVSELKHNIVALVRAAKVLDIPIIATTTAAEGLWGPTIPELEAELNGIEIIDRTTVNALDDERVMKAVEKVGRKKLLITGISTEVCLAFPALTATSKGYDVYAIINASGTASETQRTTGILRMLQAGIIVTDYSAVCVEMLADNADPRALAMYKALDADFVTLVGQLTGKF